MVVNHPVRRRIIRDLILAGNVGLTSALATLVVTLMQSSNTSRTLLLFGLCVAGLAGLMLLSKVCWLQKIIDHTIQRALEKMGVVRALDYELLLRIQHGYVVSEVEVMAGTHLAGRTLRESRPWDQGVVILSVQRDGENLPGLPGPGDMIKAGDVVTAYGKESALVKMVEPVTSGD